MKQYSFIVENPSRLDKFLSEQISDFSRAQIQKTISETGALVVSGKTSLTCHNPAQKLKAHDTVTIKLSVQEVQKILKPTPLNLDILFEDEYLIVVNKPAGLCMHVGAGQENQTLAQAILAHTKGKTYGIGSELRPGVVHRLDKDTSGIVVFAKDNPTYLKLAKLFESHNLEREYMALVWGSFNPPAGRIETYIGRSKTNRQKMSVLSNEGKLAVTNYQQMELLGPASLVYFNLETGRTHQIRVHAASRKHPLLGDQAYGNKSLALQIKDLALQTQLLKLSRQMLHARRLAFTHPITQKFLSFESSPPNDFLEIWHKLRELTP
jgi:23S rRNA pseudouridine1911/1915/1917 synthase